MTLADLPDFSAATESGRATSRSTARGPCLRVEFFGAVAAGKTTAALALSAELRTRSLPVRLIQYGRASAPGVPELPRDEFPLSTQAMKLAGAFRTLLPGGGHDPTVGKLLTIFPPGDWLHSMRIRRYAADLCRDWRDGQRNGEVLVLDQGFLTLLCSMALRSTAVDRSALARGLALVPRADLLIHVDAPRVALESRLQGRARRRRGLERLFANGIGLSLRQAEIAAILAELVAERGRAPIRVQSGDQADLDAAVKTIAGEISWLMGDMAQ